MEQQPVLPALSLQQVCLNYGKVRALDDVSLDVADGQCAAIIGPNGAGKSSLFDVLSGFYRPCSGAVYLHGKKINSCSQEKRCRLGLVRSFQQSRLFIEMTVLENLQCAAFTRHCSFWQRYAFWGSMGQVPQIKAIAQEVLQKIGLEHLANTPVQTLSYAQQRQLELGMVLATGARVLLLDEPTSGLSVEQAQVFLGYLEKHIAGRTVLLIEHDMRVVERLAHKVALLSQGQLVAYGDPSEVKCHPDIERLYSAYSLMAVEKLRQQGRSDQSKGSGVC